MRTTQAAVLSAWTGKHRATTLFDSTVDEFTASAIFQRLCMKRNIVVVGVTEDGEVFGGFYDWPLASPGTFVRAPGLFVFSFPQSTDAVPQKHPVRAGMRELVGAVLFRTAHHAFLWLGVFSNGLAFGTDRTPSSCRNASEIFEGLDAAPFPRGGRTSGTRTFFQCVRLLVLQMT